MYSLGEARIALRTYFYDHPLYIQYEQFKLEQRNQKKW